MITTQEKPNATTAVAQPPAPASTSRSSTKKTILVGFDLGTNKSCVLAGAAGTTDITVSKVVPSVVGYVKDGIVDGIIAGNRRVLFGEDALASMLHVRLVAPLAEGVIAEPEAARDFLQHIRSLADPTGGAEIRAVVGVPANAGEQAREDIRHAVLGIFDRILLIPEPFLAALGYRDDSRVAAAQLHRSGRELAVHRYRRRHQRLVSRAGLFSFSERSDLHLLRGRCDRSVDA